MRWLHSLFFVVKDFVNAYIKAQYSQGGVGTLTKNVVRQSMVWYPKHTYSRCGKDRARCGGDKDVTTNKDVFSGILFGSAFPILLVWLVCFHKVLKFSTNVLGCFSFLTINDVYVIVSNACSAFNNFGCIFSCCSRQLLHSVT